MKNCNKPMQGFTILECVVVMALASILAGIAIVNTSGSSQVAKAENATDLVLSQMRMARMLAITQRRNVSVNIDTNFTGPANGQQLMIQVVALPGDPPLPVQIVPLPNGTQFVLEPGVPDTPMNFGNSAPIYFNGTAGGPSVMQFTPSGAFLDGNNNILNGTIFLGVPISPSTARAIPIMGGAGNIQRFTWTGTQWVR